uniref:2,3-bisphosphoglycerate-independent phosphoglycerate mutase n=1 Tax=Vertebrata lanosa TaxID=1261582 RepID=A0A0B5VUZ4_9FLOR|nr:2,3-bisphosphoglycerate-independent phosphoglycerate mutase [Vertebrata lanosa]AJH66013.1 2,3-bisphosphoglycerate-independent phosphoglycerate mutase [Vertebrata lanosa]
MYKQTICPIVLMILDGWGYSKNTKGNAIRLGNTPNINKIFNNNDLALLSASGKDVGLPENQMGNSEVGHTVIGAGRIINQDLVKIQKSIQTKSFFKNKVLHRIYNEVQKRKSKLHVIGLCSDGGVHSHINHLLAIIEMINQNDKKIDVHLHLITDGRDTKPEIAIKFLNIIEEKISNQNNINISTISGRYYSMDRDCRWSRTEKAYKILTEQTNGSQKCNYHQIIQNFYEQGISDEFIPPTKINNSTIDDNDGVLFFNFRPDRVRQLIQSLAKPNFKGFNTKKINNLLFTTFTEYDPALKVPVIFSSPSYKNFLGEIISKNNIKQLRLTETEKYAHVTYFFNGGIEEPFPGEDRELIPSPKVTTYDLKPEMSAYNITTSLIDALNKNVYKLIVVNYANPDMIGHTGNLKATIKAVEVVDTCIGKVLKKIKEQRGTLIITADHGNAEYMIDRNEQPCKSHSTNLVPFVIAGNNNKYTLASKGNLADIAPTILDILKINRPTEMTGKSLITKNKKEISMEYNNVFL